MKNSIYLLPLVLVLLFSACSNEEPLPHSNLGANFHIAVSIFVLDDQGNNLLNPNHERYLDPSKIKIFYERDGRLEEFYDPNLTMPRNFRILPPEGELDYVMGVVLGEKTVIQWNENESDTIDAEIYTSEDKNLVMLTKVYFNGELKWEAESLTDTKFTIIK